MKKVHTIALPCLLATVALVSVACDLEDWMEDPALASGTDEYEACADDVEPETYRCNGAVVELCRSVGGGPNLWRPMKDCGFVQGGICEENGDSTVMPVCTGDYWVNGYCPDVHGPASNDCKNITENACCDNATANNLGNKSLVCQDGQLWCYQCGMYDSYAYGYESCAWNTNVVDEKTGEQMGYGCWADYYYYPDIIVDSDPNGVLPVDCNLAQ